MSWDDKKEDRSKKLDPSDLSLSVELAMDINAIAYNSNAFSPNPFIVKKPKKLNRI